MGRNAVVPNAKFGRLQVLAKLSTTRVQCRCECGKITTVQVDNLATGNSISCGCYRGISNKARAKHGLANNPIYSTWVGMVGRCCSPKDRYYVHYGAVGVKICKRLRESPSGLMKTLGPRPNDRPTLDRYPVHNGNYTCGGCAECRRNGWKKNIRWASHREQMLNRGSTNRVLSAFGRTLALSQWRDLSGIGWMTLYGRIRAGWEPERVVSTPDQNGNCFRPSGRG